jgi:hypothetical protein
MSEKNKDKNIGYSQFLKLCNVSSPRNWYGMAVMPDGVWVQPPSDDALLLPSERAALSEHPKNDLTIPALAFPCSIEELQQFLDWLSNYLGSSIEPVELPKKESETQPINEPSSSDPFDAGAFFNSKQTDNSKESVSDQPDNAKESVPSTPIERDEAKERALWKKHIEPIINKHNLRTKEGKLFEYKFIPKNIYNDDVLLILRRTMCICEAIEFQEAEISDKLGTDNFITKILCRLRDYETDLQKAYRKANGRQIDLRIIFQDFFNELFTSQTLPEFLELLSREIPTNKAETEAIQDEIDEVEKIQPSTIADKKMKRVQPEEGVEPDTFIRALQISYVSDTETRIKVDGKDAKDYSCEKMGFKSSETGWKLLMEVLKDADHLFHVGVYSKDKIPEKIRWYNQRQKWITQFTKKFITFINREYCVQISGKTKLLENQKKQNRDGLYKPIFQIASSDAICSTDIKKMSKNAALKRIKALETEKKCEKNPEVRYRLLSDIGNYAQHAAKMGWISETDLRKLISSPDEDPSSEDAMSVIDRASDQREL